MRKGKLKHAPPLIRSSAMADANVYPPSREFVKRAHVKGMEGYRDLYQKAAEKPEEFWGELAEKELFWFEKWSHVFEWHPPFAKWFVGGKTNVSYNCLDRHLATHRKNKVAILWEGEPGDQRQISYQELHRLVCRFANVLKGRGLKAGDRAIIYMGMVPELPVALLACARLGITHSVVFGGFSAEALKARIQDLEAQVVITADGAWRRGKEVRLKDAVDESLAGCPSVRDVIVLKRTGSAIAMQEGRDHWWHALDEGVGEDCPAEPLDSEHPLYVLYTSGTTGKPKGIVHTTAGYLLQAHMTMKWVFDLRDEDTYWCTADIGWVTGHSYIVYGPLSAGATTVMYEGAPDFPQPDRFWRLIEKYRVNIFYTSPTAIRAFIRQGDQWPNAHDMSSLRLLGSVGEPINPGGVGVVLQDHRQGALPDCGHLVADRDRRHHDRAHARRGAAEAGVGNPAHAGSPGGSRGPVRASRSRPTRKGSSSCKPALAEHGAHVVARSGALPAAVLGAHRRRVHDGRRRAPRRGRLLLDSGPRGRCHERQRPPAQHHGNRIGAGAPSRGGGSGGGGQAARDHRPGGGLLRHPEEGQLEPRTSWPKSCASGWRTKSAASPSPSRSASPTRCPKPAAAKSCGASCARS